MSRRTKLILVLVAATLVGTVIFVVFSIERSLIAVRDSYIQERVASMLIEHLERNDGSWPRNWDDLAEAHEICEGRTGGVWSFEEIRATCGIDFDADTAKLLQASVPSEGPPFKVIYLLSGATHHWSGGEPNRIIHEYLLRRAQRPSDYQSPPHLAASEHEARRALSKKGAQWEINQNGRVKRVHMGSLQGSPRYNDQDLRHVAGLVELEELILSNSDITDAGMPALANILQLKYLDLNGTRVTDDGLRYVQNMQQLKQLCLAFCQLTDGAMDELVALHSLEMLNLNFTNITDTGIRRLAELENLNDILIGDTLSSESAAKSLQSTFPNARIYHSTRPTAGTSDEM